MSIKSRLRVFITGNPGVGKTTILLFLVKELTNRSYKVAGFYCPEVREQGRRVGFQIVDISTNERDWLAKENEPGRIKIGKYTLLEENAKRIANITLSSISKADVLAIDEIGPMELKIRSVRDLIEIMLNSEKPLISVVHRSQKLLEGKTYTVTVENRDLIKYEILDYIVHNIGK
ncbi:NTPase [Sulfolobus tengchongensis]|uniref:Nucleoside-triphosphatase V6M85_05580 n=1 Tax=Sulfolobus tengchongensis TaxID=207809 RepID=A0AAX4L4F7_9CREN